MAARRSSDRGRGRQRSALVRMSALAQDAGRASGVGAPGARLGASRRLRQRRPRAGRIAGRSREGATAFGPASAAAAVQRRLRRDAADCSWSAVYRLAEVERGRSTHAASAASRPAGDDLSDLELSVSTRLRVQDDVCAASRGLYFRCAGPPEVARQELHRLRPGRRRHQRHQLPAAAPLCPLPDARRLRRHRPAAGDGAARQDHLPLRPRRRVHAALLRLRRRTGPPGAGQHAVLVPRGGERRRAR